jgi:hypothetical protein
MIGTSRNRIAAGSIFLLLGLAACSDDGTGPDDNNEQGTFSATLSGPQSASISGFAWQSGSIVDPSTNEQAWVLFLGTESVGGSFIYVLRRGNRPGTGSYSFVDLQGSGNLQDDQFGAVANVTGSGGMAFTGFSTGGTFTISSSSDQRVQGTFSIQLSGFDPATQQEVTATMSGSFNAIANTFAFPGI